MRILHTADWHLGQTLNGWSREHEHRTFFNDLNGVIQNEAVDVLLVAGDVFDGINPSGDTQQLLYSTLARFLKSRPGLQIILIAGNHDPAQRLEAPEAVLRELGVHVVGTLQRDGNGVDMDRHLIPMRDAQGVVKAHLLAVPFLRQADLPGLTLSAENGAEPAIVAAARRLHADMTNAAAARAGGLPIVAMGHLTCNGALESEGAERRIMIGGEHAVPPDIFPEKLAYVALGHLHRPQSLDGGRVRYSGSPFPLSATEIPYDHGVTLLDLNEGLVPCHIPLQRPIEVLRFPTTGAAPLQAVEAALSALNLDPEVPRDARPFVYITLTADRPASSLMAEAEALIERTPVRLAGLSIARTELAAPTAPPPTLAETSPEDLFLTAFRQAHALDADPRHIAAFRDAFSEV
ncbi:exonuclease SbcCD subunit D [Lentibacter sp. XHP0401]|uniref:exonuclease SbcCD subunit D n=1 Tax=Lentibacter sp. XHP0401 TaxID=2984334 RepID=UPI0021E79120|nr:exonuclease SbcCD subunit D [Lentibacter sp. XHP0401]MCV2894509.1 exonuclease SbcCD subunit D [Lentibacter sp. XHP0401]